MIEWKEYKLGDICNKVTSGGTPNTRKNEYYGGIIPWVRTQEVNFNRLYDAEIKISDEGLKNSSAKWIPENSVIIAMYGATAGKVAINKIPVTTNQACCNLIIDNDKADYRFVYYNILSRFSSIANMAVGGAQQNLNAGMIKDLPLYLPDLPTQTSIAEILSSLDDKIELNNKINQELESLAQTLFKQWFVDFEFPNENGEPYKSSGGEMVDSDLGEIPKGWNVKTLKDEFVLNMGQSPKGDTYNTNGDGIVFFQGRSDFGFRFPSIRMYTNDPKKIAKKFETLISVRAPVGDINMVAEDCCIGRGLGSISHTLNLYSYTYHKILSIQDELKSYDNEGTVFGSINKETLGNIKNIIPPISICKLFDQLSNDKDSLIFSLTTECQELVKTRDTLLPKLISGELEINEINN